MSEAIGGLLSRNHVAIAIVLVSLLVVLAPLTVSAQKAGGAPSSLKIGAVDVTFGGFSLKGTQGRFSAGVKMTSAQYDLTAEDVQAALTSPQSGHSGLARATAEGSRVKKTQVIAHIKRPLQSEEFRIAADHAIYVPDYSRRDGGRIDFTGHVTVLSTSGFLAGPAPADFGNGPVTVQLGQGEDYPQLQAGPGHIVVTPAQQ